MSNIDEPADQHTRRAQEMREIALGIWDEIERQALMDFIRDYERLARAAETKERT